MRRLALVAALLVALCGGWPRPALGFSGFGAISADATYDQSMVFRATLNGGAPQRLELLLDFEGSDSTFVAPVTAAGPTATYRWDASQQHVTPNTRIGYRWRAVMSDGSQALSTQGTLLYDDDRPGLDWHALSVGQARVHWVGDAVAQAQHFADLTSSASKRAEALLGHAMSGAVDIFVYQTSEQFFGALGPGAREWTGAAAYPELRTVFMYLSGNDTSYLDTVVTHEVTHVVFHDATANPFHDPARWLNEGLATWSETQGAAPEQQTVSDAARGDGLLAFDAIAEQFPIDPGQARLAYAEGATMVDMMVREHGRAAIARLAGAYRDGDSDAEALRFATGEPATQLYTDYFASMGTRQPQPVPAASLLPSIVRPDAATPSGVAASSPAPGAPPTRSGDGGGWPVAPALIVAAALLLLLLVVAVIVVANGRRP